MTAAREAFALPLMFLTVVLLGGMSPGPPVSFAPPPLFALVLAALLTAVLFRSGVLIPARLVQGSRSALAKANGLVVIFTLDSFPFDFQLPDLPLQLIKLFRH